MNDKKRKTRTQKIKDGESRKSKYGAKIKRRAQEAQKAGLPKDTPYPVILASIEAE